LITPHALGSQLLPLLDGNYTRIGKYWVWVGDDDETIHISDTIGAVGSRFHKVGGVDDRLSEFRDANGISSGRQALLDAGYRVSIDNEVLVVRKNGNIVYSHDTDGDHRYYKHYRIRGWRVARRLYNGEDGLRVAMDEERWWQPVKRIELPPEKPFWEMTLSELENWRK
jgi:hypothetical protein